MLILVTPGGADASTQQLDVTPDPGSGLSGLPKFYIEASGDTHLQGYFEDVEVLPGESVELTVDIVNDGKVPVELHTYKVNARSAVNGGYSSDDELSEPLGATAWIDYPALDLFLEPGERSQRTFRVQAPTDALPGQYIAGLVVETSSPVEVPGTDELDQIIGYAISVGILVPGEIHESFALSDPDVKMSGNSRAVLIPIANTGNYLVRPEGVVSLRNESGKVVHQVEIKMGSIYSGLSTLIWLPLPDQTPAGSYTLDASLQDPKSGATAELDSASVVLKPVADPTGVSVVEAAVEPNADEIVFANVDVTLENGGQQLSASDVTLQVLRDGEQVDEFPLARNQVLLNGENSYTTRYIPAEMWKPGEYTFRIVVSAVDPNGGQTTILLDEDLDATISVP